MIEEHGEVLYAEATGDGPRLVLVHGFTQNRLCWGPLADDLATDHEVVRVDAPGHGRSARVETDLVGGADRLAAAGGPSCWIGYSMGGRFCLHVALQRPEVVRGLVLVSATAGIDDPAERDERRRADEALAASLEAGGLDAFLEQWLALPLFAGLPAAAADVDARRENTVAGLAASLRRAGTGTQEPLWDRLAAVDVPVLAVAGEDDEKFARLAEQLVASIGSSAELAVVPGAGHTVHLERPGAFLATLRPWLARHGL